MFFLSDAEAKREDWNPKCAHGTSPNSRQYNWYEEENHFESNSSENQKSQGEQNVSNL